MMQCVKRFLDPVRFRCESMTKGLTDSELGDLLLFSSQNDGLDLVIFLVKKGVPVDFRDSMGMTALMYSCRKMHSETSRYLLSKGADVNAENNEGISPLVMSVTVGDIDTTRRLLRNGACTESTDRHERTPLSISYMNGRFDIGNVLSTHGASMDSPDMYGLYPQYYRLLGEHREFGWGPVSQFKITIDSEGPPRENMACRDDKHGHGYAGTECAICLDPIDMDQPVSYLGCGHVFHRDCLKKWSCVKNTCPNDREPFSEFTTIE